MSINSRFEFKIIGMDCAEEVAVLGVGATGAGAAAAAVRAVVGGV